MKKYQLMAPGPTPVPSQVLLAMAQPMLHHRTPEYEALFVEVRAGLKRLFQTAQDVLPFACSGTGVMEAAIANTLSAEIARLDDPGKARRRLRRYRRIYAGKPLIGVSNGVAEDLRQGLGLTRPRIERIYNPFDFAAMRAHAAEPAPGRPDVPYLIHVGRFTGQKRHDLLLDAFARLDIPHLLVLLAEREPALSELIRQRGLDGRVIVAGFQANPYPWIAGAALPAEHAVLQLHPGQRLERERDQRSRVRRRGGRGGIGDVLRCHACILAVRVEPPSPPAGGDGDRSAAR